MFERVRHRVYLDKTLKLKRDLLPSERITDADVRDYLTHMETDRTWMDQIELEASARALGVCISVWVDCPGAPGFLKFYHLANNERLDQLPMLNVWYLMCGTPPLFVRPGPSQVTLCRTGPTLHGNFFAPMQ